MGIRGLFSFAESNRKCDFFENMKLKNCQVVIDGNNLRFFLYQRTKKRHCAFGGEYAVYHAKVKTFFKNLLDQDIKPVVVMDGSFEVGKKKTLWIRAKEQLEAALNCAPNVEHRYSVMPIFAKEIFIQAVSELNIEVIQTYGEADRFIAHLASRILHCPVLSNDSDFLIFPSVTLIQLSSINVNFHQHEIQDEGIPCKKFKRSSFLNFFGLKTDALLPLCAALLGNDETSGKLASISDRIFAQVKHEKSSKKTCPRHRRMTAILKYVGREQSEDLDQALDRLLVPVPNAERQAAKELLQSAIQSYVFENEDCSGKTCCCIEEPWHDNAGDIKDLFVQGLLPNWILDVIRHQHFYFQSQVEDVQIPSCLSVCLPIISEIIGILLKDISSVTITARNGTDKRLSLINVEKAEQNDWNLKESLVFWCRNSDVSVMELSSVILWIMSLTCEKVRKLHFQKIQDVPNVFDKVVVHSLSAFQAILYFVRVLNLIKNEEMIIKSMKTWSGLSLFNLVHRYSSVQDMLAELDENDKNLFRSYFEPCSKLTSSRINSIESKKRVRRTKPKPVANIKISPEEPEETKSELDESDDEVMNNRFALLRLE